jgi:tetratricopeptide (TPR) repeat protein
MAFYVVLGAIVVLGAGYAAVIVVRKFPQLSLIDTASLPQEREAKKKKELIRQRVQSGAAMSWKRFAGRVSPLLWGVRTWYRKAFAKVLRLDYKYRRARPKRLAPEKAARKVASLMAEAQGHIDGFRLREAERALLHVLRLAPRDLEAYALLIDVYMDDRQYAHAKETAGFLMKMRGEGADLVETAKDHVRYGLACQALGERQGALEALEMAVSLEPMNPRYLDLLLEACILEGDQIRAREVLEKLKEADPMNQKVGQLEERILAIQPKS